MSREIVPLVGVPNQRNFDSLATLVAGKDQRFRSSIVGVIPNPVRGGAKLYLSKRPGFETFLTPASGKSGHLLFYSRSQNAMVSAFSGGGVTTIYVGTTSVGTILLNEVNAVSGSITYVGQTPTVLIS